MVPAPAGGLSPRGFSLLVGCRAPLPNTLATHDSSRWQKTIAAFQAMDATNRPPENCIGLCGQLQHSHVEDAGR